MDATLYDETIENPIDPKPFVDKDMLYVLDQNGGSYNGQITFDTSSLSNSGRWQSFSEGYIEVPFVITALGSVDMTGTFNSFIAGLKNGTHHLIDSIQVDYNNTNVVQLQPFTNFFVSYKLMSKFSTDDLAKWGPATIFAPDNALSYTYNAAAAVDGIGHANNKTTQPAIRTTASWGTYAAGTGVISQFNDGLYKRLTLTANNALGYGSLPEMVNVGAYNNVGKNYFTSTANGGAAAVVYQWNILATVPLKFLADFFEKIPLVKGGFMRLIINYNSCSFTITSTGAAAAAHTLTTSVPTMLSGRTNPVMVSSSNGTGVGPTDVAAGSIAFRCGVASAPPSAGNAASSILSSCRLYVPCYSLDPKHEEELISLRPVREVVYHDIYNFNITGIGAGASFNNILTNGIVNPKYVVIIPMVNVASNALANLLTYQSPFDSAPGTTAPLASIYNFNVQVGGRNIFQQNFNYDFENFMNELSRINAINGGETLGITSGLITADMWSNAYRYYVADVSRREKSEDIVPKSITIIGTNNTAITMDYICFVVFERKVKINMLDGSLVRD